MPSLTWEQKLDRDVARFVHAYGDMAATHRELFLEALEEWAERCRDEAKPPGRLLSVVFIDRPHHDDPMRNVRPQLKAVRR